MWPAEFLTVSFLSLLAYLGVSAVLRVAVEILSLSLVPALGYPFKADCHPPGRSNPDMLPEANSLWLLRLLRDVQLAQFYRPILEELNVTRPEHFDFVRPEDLDNIGMGRPGEEPLPYGPVASPAYHMLALLPHASGLTASCLSSHHPHSTLTL